METAKCLHVAQIQDVKPNAQGCEVCLRTDGWWVNLRLCRICGHVGCCDDSPGKHATQHFHETNHPIIQLGIEGGEDLWCYVDQVSVTES